MSARRPPAFMRVSLAATISQWHGFCALSVFRGVAKTQLVWRARAFVRTPRPSTCHLHLQIPFTLQLQYSQFWGRVRPILSAHSVAPIPTRLSEFSNYITTRSRLCADPPVCECMLVFGGTCVSSCPILRDVPGAEHRIFDDFVLPISKPARHSVMCFLCVVGAPRRPSLCSASPRASVAGYNRTTVGHASHVARAVHPVAGGGRDRGWEHRHYFVILRSAVGRESDRERHYGQCRARFARWARWSCARGTRPLRSRTRRCGPAK